MHKVKVDNRNIGYEEETIAQDHIVTKNEIRLNWKNWYIWL